MRPSRRSLGPEMQRVQSRTFVCWRRISPLKLDRFGMDASHESSMLGMVAEKSSQSCRSVIHAETITRVAALGAAIMITIYPP